jgi:hypothetical protein
MIVLFDWFDRIILAPPKAARRGNRAADAAKARQRFFLKKEARTFDHIKPRWADRRVPT